VNKLTNIVRFPLNSICVPSLKFQKSYTYYTVSSDETGRSHYFDLYNVQIYMHKLKKEHMLFKSILCMLFKSIHMLFKLMHIDLYII